MAASMDEVKGKIIQITAALNTGHTLFALTDTGMVYYWSSYDRKWKEMGQ